MNATPALQFYFDGSPMTISRGDWEDDVKCMNLSARRKREFLLSKERAFRKIAKLSPTIPSVSSSLCVFCCCGRFWLSKSRYSMLASFKSCKRGKDGGKMRQCEREEAGVCYFLVSFCFCYGVHVSFIPSFFMPPLLFFWFSCWR